MYYPGVMDTETVENGAKHFSPGLENVVAAVTRLSHVDGERGILLIGGERVETLAPGYSFANVASLLWCGQLLEGAKLDTWEDRWKVLSQLDSEVQHSIEQAGKSHLSFMGKMRIVIESLSRIAKGEGESEIETALSLSAKLPAVVANLWRVEQGREFKQLEPLTDSAYQFLSLIRDEVPTAHEAKALETYWNTIVDHGLNASTFTARVITSTGAPLTSALVGAMSALEGPLHGGAPGPALETVFEIGTLNRAEAVLQSKLNKGERLMGFGHRVYRVRDPRAEVLNGAARHLFEAGLGNVEFYTLAMGVEKEALRLLKKHKPHRVIQTNVEFYTALLLHSLEIPTELFTPLFAVGRSVGWLGHCIEQRKEGRLIRPQSIYSRKVES